MLWIVLGALTAVVVVAAAVFVFRLRAPTATTLPPSLMPSALDLRPSGSGESGGLTLWAETVPLLTIERLAARDLPASTPLPGTLAAMVQSLLADDRILDLVSGDRFALVRVPRALRSDQFVRALDGRTVPVLRDSSGRISGLPTVVGGAGVLGGAAAAGPLVAGAVAAAWAHQRLESSISAIGDGVDRLERRLDDADHGVIAGARAHLDELIGGGRLSAHDATELANHRSALTRVHETARRRVDRHASSLAAGATLPALSSGEVAEIERDLVLLVDAALAHGQLELVRTVVTFDGGDGAGAVASLAAAESALRDELDAVATRFGEVLALEEPGRRSPNARRKARRTGARLGAVVAGVAEVVSDVDAAGDAELLITTVAGELDIRAVEAGPRRPASAALPEG